MLKCRAAARLLMPSAHARRTLRQSSTVQISEPSLQSQEGQSGRFLRRPQRDNPDATVAYFLTAVLILFRVQYRPPLPEYPHHSLSSSETGTTAFWRFQSLLLERTVPEGAGTLPDSAHSGNSIRELPAGMGPETAKALRSRECRRMTRGPATGRVGGRTSHWRLEPVSAGRTVPFRPSH